MKWKMKSKLLNVFSIIMCHKFSQIFPLTNLIDAPEIPTLVNGFETMLRFTYGTSGSMQMGNVKFLQL